MDEAHVPVTVRYGLRKLPDGPFDGLPRHLVPVLNSWTFEYLDHNEELATRLVNRLHVAPDTYYDNWGNEQDESASQALRSLLKEPDPAVFLDVVEYVLAQRTAEYEAQTERLLSSRWMDETSRTDPPATTLEALLVEGASIWTVSSDGKRLQQRVSDVEVRDYLDSTTPADAASEHLNKVWIKVYGLHPDPSDAWDHSIKAVEAIYIPIVCPTKDKANLGSVAGDLKAQPQRWRFALGGGSSLGGVATLEAMMRLIWPNPDRHEGSNHRTPTPAEAAAVLRTAITLVQWGRSGLLTKV